MQESKPNFEIFKNTLKEIMKAYQEQPGSLIDGPRSDYLRSLPAPENRQALGASSSSSGPSSSSAPSSSGPTSYGPDTPAPASQPSRKGGTDKEYVDTIEQGVRKGKSWLVDQISKRPGYGELLKIVDSKGYTITGSELAKT